MSTYISKLFESKGLEAVSQGTGIPINRLQAFQSGDEEFTAKEAMALGGYFDIDARVLLNKQAEEQLAKLDYVEPKKTPKKKAGTTKSSKFSKRREPNGIGRSRLI